MTARGTRRWAVPLAAGYLVVAVAAWLALWRLADDWGPATFLAFGPRWPLAVPLLPLAALAGWGRSWAAGGLVAAAAVVVAGPVCGGVVSLPAGGGRGAVGVLTCNLEGAAARPAAVRALIAAAEPTLVAFQEAPHDPTPLLPPGYNYAAADRLVVAARYPVRLEAKLDLGPSVRDGVAARFVVELPVGDLTVINLHLPTPRPALEAVAHRRLGGLPELARNTASRDAAAAAVRAYVGPPDRAVVIVGDFNTPVEGRIYARHWADFQNAFSAAGLGWGQTRTTKWHAVRIDHILTHPGWTCRRAWVGPDVGSDHRPVLADFDLFTE